MSMSDKINIQLNDEHILTADDQINQTNVLLIITAILSGIIIISVIYFLVIYFRRQSSSQNVDALISTQHLI